MKFKILLLTLLQSSFVFAQTDTIPNVANELLLMDSCNKIVEKSKGVADPFVPCSIFRNPHDPLDITRIRCNDPSHITFGHPVYRDKSGHVYRMIDQDDVMVPIAYKKPIKADSLPNKNRAEAQAFLDDIATNNLNEKDSADSHSLGIFPNPATTEIYLAAQLPDGIESAYIHIYTADGKLMEVRNALDCRGLCSLNINDYANGQYTVQLIVDSRMFAIEKFTVSK